MQKTFADTMRDMRGLIHEWSAPCCHTESVLLPSEEHSDVRILLAVSGGIDSMCMAELFASLEEPLPFAIAHCNFNLRSEESDGDEALVREWASSHDVELHVKSFDTEAYAHEHGISIEMAARDLRYAWFAELCARHKYAAVCVAHNANDNAETLMLNILRGAGLRGLSGMSKVSSVPSAPSVPLLRPLLDCTRKQIEGYMFAHKVPYREDSTNASSDYKRNRLRNEVFPIFASVNPSFVRTLNREMGYFSEAGEIVDDWCRSAVQSVVKEDGNGLKVDLQTLMSNRHWRYLLYYILEPYGFNSSVLASLEDLLTSSRTISGKRFESPTHVLLTGRKELTVIPLSDDECILMTCHPRLGGATAPEEWWRGSSKTFSSDSGKVEAIMPVRGKGIYNFNGRRFKVEVISKEEVGSLKQPEGMVMMDAGKLRFPFVLRRWRTGDWLIPFGMRGKKKVSDLFADLKYDGIMKAGAVMIVDTMTEGMAENQHLAGVACLRIDNSYRITDNTTSIIRITEIK